MAHALTLGLTLFQHIENLTLEFIFGYVLFPVAWLMGVEGREEILKVSQILALKGAFPQSSFSTPALRR